MKLNNLKFSMIGAALIMLGVFACKDDFTEEDLLQQQQQAKLDELKALTASDSLKFLAAMKEFEYRKYIDSLARVDSIAVAQGLQVYLPYSYEVQVLNGSVASINNGKTAAFPSDVTVTITQYGVKQTQTGTDGLFTFENIGVGMIHGTIQAPGFTTFSWTVDASLAFQFFKEAVDVESQAGGAAGGTNGVGGPGTILTYLENQYILEECLKYFNQRSFGNDFTIFETAGANAHTISGRAFVETNTTNRSREVVPEGTQITAYIDVNGTVENPAGTTFANLYVTRQFANDPSNDTDTEILNSVFEPRNWAYEFLATAATNASGDFALTTPGSPHGLPLFIEYDEFVADKTYFIQTNGEVSQVTRRNIYGPVTSASYTDVPDISLAPTITFSAGSGATATATVSGDGSITDIDLTNGGSNFRGTPRVHIAPPPAGGTQATATATVTNGVVTEITITNAGSGYTGAPAVTITEGAGATADGTSLVYNTANGGVANVILTAPGSGYNGILPNVVFYADLNGNLAFNPGEQLTAANFPTGVNSGTFQSIGTNFPTAVAVENSATGGAGLASINVTASGNGLSFAPRVLITSGLGATANVTVTGGAITAVTITNGGLFYSAAPVVTLPGAVGATTLPVLTPTIAAGVVTAIAITNPGVAIPLADGSYALTITSVGSGATGTVVWQGNGVAEITVTASGTAQADGLFYTNTPLVVVDEPDFKGTGSERATAVAILGQDGRLIGIDVTDEGFGYYNAPNVTIVSGSGAAATATLGNRFISEIDVTNAGTGYIEAPEVIIVSTDNAGSGATAVANIEEGKVTSIEVTNGGTGYATGAVTVIILNPGTSYDALAGAVYTNTAKANVFVENGVVTSVDVYDPGDNYPAGTRVQITSGKGNGFTATATVTNGEITDVTVVNGGSGYVGNNYLRGIGASFNPDADVDGNLTTAEQISFSGIPTYTAPKSSYKAKSGVRRVFDIEYGSGKDSD